jgi:hypothetical protein
MDAAPFCIETRSRSPSKFGHSTNSHRANNDFGAFLRLCFDFEIIDSLPYKKALLLPLVLPEYPKEIDKPEDF